MPRFELVEVPLSDRALVERFIRVPWHIHRNVWPNEHWVPPLLMDRRDFLNPKKNPFFEHAQCAFWLATVDGQDVARIAAVHDIDYERHHGERVGYFGMFECPDDPELARALIDQALDWLRPRGITRVIGPTELSMNYLFGVLVDAFDREPGMNMPFNPPYYDALMASAGLRKVKDVFQWGIDVREGLPSRVERMAGLIKTRESIQLRNIDLSDWSNEVERTLEIYNEAWEDNWGFVPIGRKEYQHIAKDLKMVMHPTMGLMAEVDGEPVAFALTIMNINPILKKLDGRLFPTGLLRLLWDLKVAKRVRSGRLVLMGIKAGYRRRGIETLLSVESFRAGRALGWPGGEIGWTLEDNDMVNRAIEAMRGEKIATYRMYETELAPPP
ncbi:MAG: N-acetyltransferase [Myxococcales bacterium FL481]|nr:MAG: N-acetyltransferase [Myxococcales bacterium FL481]